MKFCVRVGVPDVITHANFGDDRFRGFWGSGGRISHFSITYAVALKTLWHVPECDSGTVFASVHWETGFIVD